MFTRKTIAVAALVVVAAFVTQYYTDHAQQKKIAEYYSTIEKQEKTEDDVTVTDSELEQLDLCQKNNQKNRTKADSCMRSFYDTYTMEHGAQKAFAHLARLQKEHPSVLPSCHYISHGIGHAVLRLSGKDPYKAFTVMQSKSFYKNVATCGNGFFHGVIEEVAKGITDTDQLVKTLGAICPSDMITEKGACFHGVGHAVMIQTHYNVNDTLSVCDRISTSSNDAFVCYSGGFMEYAQVFTDGVAVADKKVNFVLCDALDKKYQAACYLEQSSFFDVFAKEKGNYVKNIGFCKQIGDAVNRMACIKLFALRSVRLVHYEDIYDMCRNTSSPQERVMCTAAVADKIGSSLDDTHKSEDYQNVVQDVCGALSPLSAYYCKNLVFQNRQQLFFTGEQDLHFPATSIVSIITSIFKQPSTIIGGF